MLRTATAAWWRHQSPARAAAIAFYTLTAMAPVMIVGVAGLGRIFENAALRDNTVEEIGAFMGPGPAEVFETVIEAASRPADGILAPIVAVLVVLVSTAAVFGQLHTALNTIWRAEPEDAARFRRFVQRRAISLGLVFSIGLALFVAVAIRVTLGALADALAQAGAPFVEAWTGSALPIYVGVFLLFSLLNALLPDARVTRTEAALGGAVAATLFVLGASAMGTYLSRTAFTSVYGAAGSLVASLLWVYYSSLVFLWGAEVARASHLAEGNRLTGAEPDPAPETEAAGSAVRDPETA